MMSSVRVAKRLLIIFLIALILNGLWENAHAFLYVHYMGQHITERILMRAALFDALCIMLASWPLLAVSALQKRSWLIIVAGFVFAVGLEWYALATGRWQYTGLMPIIPWLGVGLTPAVQLGLLGYGSYRLAALRVFNGGE